MDADVKDFKADVELLVHFAAFATITLGAFMNYMILTGVLKSFGILYAELLDQYDITSGQGALSGFLSTTFSFRGVTFVGGLLIGSGLCFSGLTSRPEMLFLTYSLLTGTGIGLCIPSSLSIVNFYFNKKRALASGIVTSAGGVSALIFPALYRWFFDSYGIRGGLVLLGGVVLNVCVGSLLLRQPAQLRKRTQFDNEHTKSFLNSCWTETRYMDDLTGNWNASFYSIGVILILSAILVLIGTLTYNVEQKSQDINEEVTLEFLQSPESKPMLVVSNISRV
ncbi:unnamed protein product [Mytilus edulis]|uniref:Monocarboxylate transporter n=1 Tax=Mytilus edulis TaxID=6550 RepID=A0A8S3VLM2_MYTED|nr:unnamed protein product [Mytilus edulis]